MAYYWSLICSACFSMCSSTRLPRAVTGSSWVIASGWHSVIVHSTNKCCLWSTLWGVRTNFSASPLGLHIVDASIFMGDRTSTFCTWEHAIMCKLAGRMFDKGTYEGASLLWPREGPAHVCAGPLRKPLRNRPHVRDQ